MTGARVFRRRLQRGLRPGLPQGSERAGERGAALLVAVTLTAALTVVAGTVATLALLDAARERRPVVGRQVAAGVDGEAERAHLRSLPRRHQAGDDRYDEAIPPRGPSPYAPGVRSRSCPGP